MTSVTHEKHPQIMQTLIDWQRSGINIDEQIATLSTYLGHVSPVDTYWYLSASPERCQPSSVRIIWCCFSCVTDVKQRPPGCSV